ncbi:uncharacterized protein BDZ83DRAFT_650036 [Colletotrichum acutatum]|uniref:Uncharacterized protein n=1 Tax=Glomerella acutata TaxID=27357 RepID=A0AAD8XJM7_GLOAC|nr:uncharacterized protein BDZ83DRAFT_650036 [Colletotrichum acutatum]KAK1726960.1 hypothetical protein BDZ83DRAFT_650036 [Colletotrichum acutatum]
MDGLDRTGRRDEIKIKLGAASVAGAAKQIGLQMPTPDEPGSKHAAPLPLEVGSGSTLGSSQGRSNLSCRRVCSVDKGVSENKKMEKKCQTGLMYQVASASARSGLGP